MRPKLCSHYEQTAEAIRGEILACRWGDTLPGIVALERELGVNRNTIQKALKILEGEKILIGQGRGMPRRVSHADEHAPRSLRIGIMRYEINDMSKSEWMVDVRHKLEKAGHVVVYAPGCLSSLNMDPRRIAQAVAMCEVDAWVVVAAPEKVLRWFIKQPVPVFAMCGNPQALPMAAVLLGCADRSHYRDLIGRWIALGHRRIVHLSRGTGPHGIDGPGSNSLIRILAGMLETNGLPAGPDNWPSFGDAPDRLMAFLNRFFDEDPPTAIYVDEAFLGEVVYLYLLKRGLRVPEDVSLVCNQPSVTLGWNRHAISHFTWSFKPMVRRTVRWVESVARGREDLKQVYNKVEFVERGSIGPAPAVKPLRAKG